jgi:hypothetical protein
VRITSFGCGGLVDGSGFAVGPDLVVTAAHVIAGVKRPIVKSGLQSFAAVPVRFDANQDIAILHVPGLNNQPLSLAAGGVNTGSTVYAIGYPKSIYTVVPGVVRNDLQVFGPNIYNQGAIGRNIYEVQTHIDEGDSGGPVVLPDGRVAGLILSKSADSNYGYALTSSSFLGQVQKATTSLRRVSTGVCYAG